MTNLRADLEALYKEVSEEVSELFDIAYWDSESEVSRSYFNGYETALSNVKSKIFSVLNRRTTEDDEQ